MLDGQSGKGQSLTMGLDSGAPALQVPVGLSKIVQAKLGGKFSKQRLLEIGCDVVDAKASIDFKMTDNTTIPIPLRDFVMGRLNNGKTCRLALQFGSGVPAGKDPNHGPFVSEALYTVDMLTPWPGMFRSMDRRPLSSKIARCLRS